MEPLEKIGYSLLISALLVFSVSSVYYYLNIPRVYMSHLSSSCIKVNDENYSCFNLPEKYQTIWVK
jgi:cell division protein FtsL